MKKRFTEEQIIRILQEGKQAENIREVCRQHNLSEQTFYRWRNKYGGITNTLRSVGKRIARGEVHNQSSSR